MSTPCAIEKCKRPSRVSCDCCQKILCLQHLTDHTTLLLAELNPLTDDINLLHDRLLAFTVDQFISDGCEKLEEWKKDCHEKIDRFLKKKTQELKQLITDKLDRQKFELRSLQSKINRHIEDKDVFRHDIDSITTSIHQIKKEIEKIEKTNIQIITHPMITDDNLIQITELKEAEFDLLKISSVHLTLARCSNSSPALACNDRFMLIHEKSNLCLVNEELNIIKQILWTHGTIFDMCWSRILDRFIVIDDTNIFLIDENMSIEIIQTNGKRTWFTCMCSDTSLFLSTNEYGSSLLELTLSPEIHIIRKWKPPITCSQDEMINGMSYQSKRCALIIKNRLENSVRIELRSIEKLECIWSLALNIAAHLNISFRCCSTKYDSWLVIDYEAKRLLHVTKDGQLKETLAYQDLPYNAIIFGSSIFAVLTKTTINFHKV